MTGIAGDYASLYSEHLESPKHFFYMSFLTFFGLSVSDRFCLYSQRRPPPRYYMILLGESADTRKSTAIEETDLFFQGFFEKGTIAVCRGAASGEGIGSLLMSAKKVLLYYDELKVFVDKCNIKNSTLLPITNILFESTRYENRTSKEPIVVEDARLSMLSASTTDTYANLFSHKYLDIGFNNRLFLVPGDSDKVISWPLPVPMEKKQAIYSQIKNRLELVKDHPELSLTQEAAERWEGFYKSLKGSSPHTKRLDVYAMRFMPLLAINDKKIAVDLQTIEKVIKLIDWQHQVRRVYDPIDAEGKIATMEEKIRRKMIEQRQWKKRKLQRKVNYNRDGIWVWEKAVQNLQSNKEIIFDSKTEVFTGLEVSI
jgi:hypothetical protein